MFSDVMLRCWQSRSRRVLAIGTSLSEICCYFTEIIFFGNKIHHADLCETSVRFLEVLLDLGDEISSINLNNAL